jgi:hypothetical protein
MPLEKKILLLYRALVGVGNSAIELVRQKAQKTIAQKALSQNL